MSKKDPKIAFYSGSVVHTIFERYEFTDVEKKVIYAAIITAKKEQPDMKLIDKADALLEMVSSSRKPVENVESSKIRMQNYIKAETKNSLEMTKYKPDWSAKPLLLVGALTIFFYILGMQLKKQQQADWYIKDSGTHVYSEAKKICKLPTVAQLKEAYEQSSIFTSIPEYFSNKGYWVKVNNKPMIYRIRDDEAMEVPSDELYEVRCFHSRHGVNIAF